MVALRDGAGVELGAVGGDESNWLGDTDAVLLVEDEAGNKKQAARNRRIRAMLEERKKRVGDRKKSQGGFAEIEEGIDTSGEAEAAADAKAPVPWFVARNDAGVSLRLHEELLDFLAFIRLTPEETVARKKWVAAVDEAARSIWPHCCVQLFGSSSTGLCLPTADVDLVMTGIGNNVRDTTALKRLAERLLERNEVSKLEIIQSSKVPVMKLQQRSTGLMGDVIVNRVDGLETSQFIRDQMDLFPALMPLVLFLKLYLSQRGLGETFGGGMGSFLLVIVVLSFLQRHPSARSLAIYEKTTLSMLLMVFFSTLRPGISVWSPWHLCS